MGDFKLKDMCNKETYRIITKHLDEGKDIAIKGLNDVGKSAFSRALVEEMDTSKTLKVSRSDIILLLRQLNPYINIVGLKTPVKGGGYKEIVHMIDNECDKVIEDSLRIEGVQVIFVSNHNLRINSNIERIIKDTKRELLVVEIVRGEKDGLRIPLVNSLTEYERL